MAPHVHGCARRPRDQRVSVWGRGEKRPGSESLRASDGIGAPRSTARLDPRLHPHAHVAGLCSGSDDAVTRTRNADELLNPKHPVLYQTLKFTTFRTGIQRRSALLLPGSAALAVFCVKAPKNVKT